jgi:hypothetical protein
VQNAEKALSKNKVGVPQADRVAGRSRPSLHIAEILGFELFGETLFASEGGQQSGILLDEVACYQYTTFDSLVQQFFHRILAISLPRKGLDHEGACWTNHSKRS